MLNAKRNGVDVIVQTMELCLSGLKGDWQRWVVEKCGGWVGNISSSKIWDTWDSNSGLKCKARVKDNEN